MTYNVIIDHINGGHFDDDLGRMARNPEYAECSISELKATLADEIAERMAIESNLDLVAYAPRVVILLFILAVLYVKWLLEVPL